MQGSENIYLEIFECSRTSDLSRHAGSVINKFYKLCVSSCFLFVCVTLSRTASLSIQSQDLSRFLEIFIEANYGSELYR